MQKAEVWSDSSLIVPKRCIDAACEPRLHIHSSAEMKGYRNVVAVLWKSFVATSVASLASESGICQESLFQWASVMRADQAYRVTARSLAVDQFGNSFVGRYFSGAVDFGTTNL